MNPHVGFRGLHFLFTVLCKAQVRSSPLMPERIRYMWLFAAFLTIPIIEIALFIQIGDLIGLFPTLLIVILTAIIGANLVRSQGRREMNRLRTSLSSLSDPSEPLAHGAMILFSGALLLTPGFFTDTVGFALLVPKVREFMFCEIRKRIKINRFEMGNEKGPETSKEPPIDVEFENISKNSKPNHNSGWTKQK